MASRRYARTDEEVGVWQRVKQRAYVRERRAGRDVKAASAIARQEAGDAVDRLRQGHPIELTGHEKMTAAEAGRATRDRQARRASLVVPADLVNEVHAAAKAAGVSAAEWVRRLLERSLARRRR